MTPVALPGGLGTPFDDLLGGTITAASATRVVLELPVTPKLHQPYGVVHGGVYASIAETTASVGAALAVESQGRGAVGVSNHTDFLHAVRRGTLRAEATPLSQSRTLQLWQVQITDEDGRLVAHSKVKLYNVRLPAEG